MQAFKAAAEKSATAKAVIPALPYPSISCGGERFVHPSNNRIQLALTLRLKSQRQLSHRPLGRRSKAGFLAINKCAWLTYLGRIQIRDFPVFEPVTKKSGFPALLGRVKQSRFSQTSTRGVCLKNANSEIVSIGFLTGRTNGPIIGLSGCVCTRPTTAERVSTMKHPILGALRRLTSNEIHPTERCGAGTIEAGVGVQQRADGRFVRGAGRPAMAQVHWWRDSAGNQPAPFVLRSSALGAGRESDQPCLGSDAIPGSNDRSGQTVVPAADQQSSFAYIANQIAVEAIRASAMAPSTSEALDIVGAALIRITYLLKNVEVKHG